MAAKGHRRRKKSTFAARTRGRSRVPSGDAHRTWYDDAAASVHIGAIPFASSGESQGNLRPDGTSAPVKKKIGPPSQIIQVASARNGLVDLGSGCVC